MSTTTTKQITPDSTMEEVLEAYPGAKRALFRAYHIGGCSSCGYAPTDHLKDVLGTHGVENVDEAITYLAQCEESERKLLVEPKALEAQLKAPNPPKLLDIRTPDEFAIARIDGGRLVDQALFNEMMSTWAKDTAIVCYCHVGERSLEAASYMIGHGFTNVKSLAGGIDAWSEQVDKSVAQY